MPFHGQLSQLRAWSDRPGRQDPRARKGGVNGKDRQKSVKRQKFVCRQDALAAQRNRNTRARRERRRRAKLHAQAASNEASPTKTQRGGESKKRKRRVRRKFGKVIRCVKRQKQRRQQRNKQIWQELHTTWLKKDSAEDQSVQPTEEKVTETSMTPTGSDGMKRSNENQYWLAVSQEAMN